MHASGQKAGSPTNYPAPNATLKSQCGQELQTPFATLATLQLGTAFQYKPLSCQKADLTRLGLEDWVGEWDASSLLSLIHISEPTRPY